MIFPYAHEDMKARRWPVVTTALIALNVLAYVGTFVVSSRVEPEADESLAAALTLYAAHPSLTLSPHVQALVSRAPELAADLAHVAEDAPHDRLRIADRSAKQEELDAACERFEQAFAALPSNRFGYQPAHPRVWQLVTAMFVHAGIFHLLGNMWFLWLACVSLEDRWGRLAFAGFYLAAGMLASVVHGLVTPDKTIPLVGASGAIAGAMGAFLAIFARTRIRFLFFFYMRPTRFSAPAYVMLPLWIGEQVWDSVTSAGDGVAYVAHVAGFSFGLAVALGLKFGGVDAKLDRAVEGTVSIGLDPKVESAEALESQGRRDEAMGAARDALAGLDGRKDARRTDVLGALRVLTNLAREPADYERFVALAALDDLTLDEAARLTSRRIRELGEDVVAPLPVPLRIRLAKRLEKLGEADTAAKVRPA